MNQDDNSIPLLTEVIPVAPPQVLPPQTLATPMAYQPQVDHTGYTGHSDDNHLADNLDPANYSSAAYPGAFHTPPEMASYQGALPDSNASANANPAAGLSFSPEYVEQWQDEIRENVLQRLLAQADTVLQQQLQEQMAVVLDNIAEILTQRVKESLRQALTETVTHAVAQEMARFMSSRR